MSLYNWNHIDKKLSEAEVKTLKDLYAYYHKKTWCYKKGYRHFKLVNATLNLASISLTSIGTIAGAVTLNPIILGCITGSGVVLQGFIRMRKYGKKIEMCKFAFTSYQKILNKIRSYLRGESFNIDNLVLELQFLDDQVTDLCPLVDKYNKKYYTKYDTK